MKYCTGCGSTDYEDMLPAEPGDEGYSSCCNEPIEFKRHA